MLIAKIGHNDMGTGSSLGLNGEKNRKCVHLSHFERVSRDTPAFYALSFYHKMNKSMSPDH